MFGDQERLWRQTVVDTPAVESEARRGGLTPMEVDPKMLHDISVVLSRLVAESKQLIGNHTTNLADIRAKFDGGKVINWSQSGSWEHRCMGAGLHHNMALSGNHRHGKQLHPPLLIRYFLLQQTNLLKKVRLTGRRRHQKRQKRVNEGANTCG